MHRAIALLTATAFVVVATGCTSNEGPPVATPPVFQERATDVETPDEAASFDDGKKAVPDDQRIAAALAQLLEADLEKESGTKEDELLDAGIVSTSIDADRGGEIVIETCTWRSSAIRQANRTYRYQVDTELNVTLVEARTFGDCMNSAILESAGEFAAEAVDHFFEFSTDDRDPTDPALATYWHASKIDGLQQVARRHLDGFRVVRFGPPPGSGVPVAWAYNETGIELVVAVRYDYDERYGTYDTRTDVRLAERTPQIPPDDLVGDNQVIEVMLWWDPNETHWRTFAMEDLYGIRCTTNDCVETLNAIGQTPNRPVHQTIDFAGLNFVAIAQ